MKSQREAEEPKPQRGRRAGVGGTARGNQGRLNCRSLASTIHLRNAADPHSKEQKEAIM